MPVTAPSPIADVPPTTIEELRDRAFRAFRDACDAARPLANAVAAYRALDSELETLADEDELGERYESLAQVTLVDRLRKVLYAHEAWLIDAFGVVTGTDLTPDDLTGWSRELRDAAGE